MTDNELSAAVADRAMDEARGDLAAAIAPTDVGGGAAQTARAIIEQRDALAAENARLREASGAIARYDVDSPYGAGICPYGCDTPNIARAALRAQPGEDVSE